ncbi:tRNA S(4)U 4-thiouridine synthase [Lentilactobacillus kosonis]|uniref:tRNA S(4)U 4-thiouridine synthase n=1 Tax=Lentilactobacillus kosonis TaxID=2810561 RepID=A0A401FN63_9LACO|nr:tRNA S(4)U 4-thiouridine synthase [Lentilactobacillus kosonis]
MEKSRKFEQYIDVDELMQRSMVGMKIFDIKPGEDYMNVNADVFAELL